MNARAHVAVAAVVALGWRAVLCARTPVPSEDGVNHLWMAERFAAGDFAAPLGEVFPPLLALLAAPLVCLGLDAWLAAQVVLALGGALAVVAGARLVAACGGDGVAAAWLLAAATLPARFCAEVYTEPLFVLVMAGAALAGVRGRWVVAGALAGVGFWLRSEALVLPVAFAVTRRGAWRSLVPAAAAVGTLALWRGFAGHGFDPLPKLAFNWHKAAVGGGDDGLLANLASLPAAWLEAFGAAGVLALFGLFGARARARSDLRLALLLGVVVVVAFATRRRFLVAWWPALLPFAVFGLERLRGHARLLALACAVVLSAALGLRTTASDRIAERAVAEHLRAQLAPGERLASDLTRVLYFAGQRPLPPRHLTPDELIAAATAPGVRFVVLGARRDGAATVRAALGAFTEVDLPAPLRDLTTARGLLVLRR